MLEKPIGNTNLDPYGLVEVYNPGTSIDGAVTLDEPFLPETFDVRRTGVLNRPGGFLRVQVWKEIRGNRVTFTAGLMTISDAQTAHR